jgi:hypothetical protein
MLLEREAEVKNRGWSLKRRCEFVRKVSKLTAIDLTKHLRRTQSREWKDGILFI